MNKLAIRKRLAARRLARKASPPIPPRRTAKAAGDDKALSDATRAKVVEKVRSLRQEWLESLPKVQEVELALEELAGAIERADVEGAKAAQAKLKSAYNDWSESRPDIMSMGSITSWILDNVKRPEGAGKAAPAPVRKAALDKHGERRRLEKKADQLRRQVALEPISKQRRFYEAELKKVEQALKG